MKILCDIANNRSVKMLLKNLAQEKNDNLEIIDTTIRDALCPQAKTLIDVLGKSSLELSNGNVSKIKNEFPVPREQHVYWADAEFDLGPSGIVCTDKGIFIKTNVEILAKNIEKPDGKKEKEKSALYYFRWEDFEPNWFTSDDVEENRALLVELQCTKIFVNGCRQLLKQMETNAALHEVDFMFEDDEIEKMIAKVAPIEVAGLQSAQSAVFVEQKSAINTPAGHGEMAEEAITLMDRVLGHDAIVVGRDNAKNGADRLVDGIYIQTKYYNSATGSCEACFGDDGMYRYMHEGKPMQLEVPKDQYEAVLERFEMKIRQGKVPGVTDPADAKKIVRKVRLTYAKAVNLTKLGTIESLSYDAATGGVTCSCAFGITFVATVFLTWRKTGMLKRL